MHLYIVGNGFDLHHHLKTSPKDYCDFLNKKHPDILKFIQNCDYFMGDGNELLNREDRFWTNVEDNFAFSFDSMLEETVDGNYPDLDDDDENRWQRVGIVAKEKVESLSDLKLFNTSYLAEWVNTIDFTSVSKSKQLQFKKKDLFLTFNYTKTLEYIYKIQPSNILHIHGCISSPETLQFGNSKYTANEVKADYEQQFKSDEAYEICIEPAVNSYIDLARSLSKDPIKNIPLLKQFLSKKQIDEIIILGHSYQGVDAQYYEKMLLQRLIKAKWTIYCYTDKDFDDAQKYIYEKRLNGKAVYWN